MNSGYSGNIEKNGICYNHSDPKVFGDEAVMIAEALDLEVFVGKNRAEVIQSIVASKLHYDIILSDDGLQHYKMAREKEIIIYNKNRIGNGFCFPVGPLREPKSRLDEADIVIDSLSQDYTIKIHHFTSLSNNKSIKIQEFSKKIHAVAGIGNPDKFFQSLRESGFEVVEHPFSDHHQFIPSELHFDDTLPIVMTTKDAVKCRAFANNNMWKADYILKISPKLETLITQLIA